MNPQESAKAATTAPGARVLEPIASTKTSPPRGTRLIPRDALIARLLDARRKRCLVMQGPPGSGKTSVLIAWRQALIPLDFDVAWLSLSFEDDEPNRFFDCLLASLAEVDPAIGRDAACLLGHGGDPAAVEHWVIRLVQDLARRPRELMLILDDLHQVEHPSIFQALQWLLDYAPPDFHLAIGSRTVPPLLLARLRGREQLAEFDLRDLRFTADESERFLRDRLGAIDHDSAQRLHEMTDGWVAGLQLFAVDLKARGDDTFAPVQLRDAKSFATYFEREVLARLPADELRLMTRVAICNRFCASLCAHLLGEPFALARMTTRLVKLDRGNLFVSQVSAHDREVWYRIHPLLREVLQARLSQLAQEELRGLHGTAWRWFDARGYIDEAVRHAVQAGEIRAAVDLVEGCADELHASGSLNRLAGLIQRLPSCEVRGSVRLRMATAYLHLYARRLEALRESLQALEADSALLTPRQRYSLALLHGGLALQSDDPDAIDAIRSRLHDIPADVGDAALVGRNHILAWMHAFGGEYASAMRLLNESARHEAGPGRRIIRMCLEAMCRAIEGRMAEAEALSREALRQAEAHTGPDPTLVCLAAGLLGDALYEANDPEAVVALFEQRIDTVEHVATPDTVLRTMLALCFAQWSLGRRAQAFTLLQRLESYAARQRLPRLLAYALLVRHRWHARRDEIEAAHEVLARLETLAVDYDGAGPTTAAEIARCVERAHADRFMQWHDFDAAARAFATTLAAQQAAGRWRMAAGAAMQLAVARRAGGDQPAARAHALEALRLGHRLGLVRSILDASPVVPELLQELSDAGLLDPVLDFYAQRLLAEHEKARQHRTVSAPVPGAATQTDRSPTPLSERELEVLELLAQAMPNKKIARVLGVTPHTVKWHLRKIYQKFGVNHRDEAVARYRDRGAGAAARPPG